MLDPRSLAAPLLAWFAAHRRDLPWRRTRDPYAIWVSEVMLQQTTVETVLGRFGPFLERFPDLPALARAEESEVLAAWSGLGYYRRARGLHAAAREVLRAHGGALPADPAALRALPGFGPYTAGAVASIAFGRRAPLVDGNVARVLARLFRVAGEPTRGPARRRLWELAEAALPPERADIQGGASGPGPHGGASGRGPHSAASGPGPGGASGPGDFNQALMELGALVCRPAAPRCDGCPLAAHCEARAAGEVERYPTSARRAEAPLVRRAALYLQRPDGAWLLVRRPPEGLLARLWELPAVDLGPRQRAEPAARALAARLGTRARLSARGAAAHQFTHRRWEVATFAARVSAAWEPRGLDAQAWCFAREEDLPALGVPTATRKVLAAARAREAAEDARVSRPRTKKRPPRAPGSDRQRSGVRAHVITDPTCPPPRQNRA